MQARLTERPQHEVIAAIQALDLESIKLRVMDAELGEGWTREYADSIEAAYKTYLTMLVKYQEDAEDILLSEDVDEFWHTHILQTRKYAEDCEKMFGNFLHHEPHVGERTFEVHQKRAALARKTQRLYEQEFGDEHCAVAAWTGSASGVTQPAYSGDSIKPQSAAYSGTSVHTTGAAYSGASINGEKAAYSDATIEVQHAAYSGASIRTQQAAYSGASIQAGKAAYSGAAIKAQHAAYSGASIRAQDAAYSGASIKAEEAAYSGASISRTSGVPNNIAQMAVA